MIMFIHLVNIITRGCTLCQVLSADTLDIPGNSRYHAAYARRGSIAVERAGEERRQEVKGSL